MKNRIGIISRVLLAICAVALAIVLFVPLWKIDLSAPQYPEGLSLLIFSNKLGGNVDVINGLNHYIGMKTLHAEDFIEFTVLPYLIILFALLFILASLAGRRKFLNAVFIMFLVFGIIAMIDFWKWEYNYGHNLDPNAAIKVPGMSYQPPFIGYKQLLNFSAYSMPAIGGWLFIGVGVLALAAVGIEWKATRKPKASHGVAIKTAVASLLVFVVSCETPPAPIKIGVDDCSSCKMTISDVKYGAEIVTKKGKVYKFDDTHCLLSYLEKSIESKDIGEIYVTDFEGKHDLLPVKKALFFKSEELHSPMGGNIAAFGNKASLETISQKYKGEELPWDQLGK